MWMALHGFTGAPRSWDRVFALADLEREPMRPFLMGHGHDWEALAVESFDEEIARLRDLASSLDSPRFLCGYSMGARVALALLTRSRGIFAGAVLVGVHPGLRDPRAIAERRSLDAGRARTLREGGLEAFVTHWEAEPIFATQDALAPEILDYQRAVRLEHTADGLARSLEVLGLAEMPDCTDAMVVAQTPLVLVAGGLDDKFAAIARRFSSSADAVHIVPNVGHNVVLEAPHTMAEIVQTMERSGHG